MASQCRSSKCTAERKGVRRELDSWRHKLIRCVGFESILEGIYGQRLLRDLSIFADCEPEVVSDWSVEASCSFCNLQLDKISDHIPTVSSPQSSPTEDLPAQGESYTEKIKYQADKFLHAVFRKKDPPQSCDQNIPLVAQELMKKMIRQFAIEYASKNQFDVGQNGSSMCMGADDDWLQRSSDQDGPLDLTVTRPHPVAEQDGALDLSRKGSSSSTESICTSQKDSGRPLKDDYVERSSEFSEGLLSKALKDVLSGSLDFHKAAILYGIPQKTLLLQLATLPNGKVSLLESLGRENRDTFFESKSGETLRILQKVASWARHQAEDKSQEGATKLKFPAASTYLNQLNLQKMILQLKEKNETLFPQGPTTPTVHLKIPQVRLNSAPKPQADFSTLVNVMYQVSNATSATEVSTLQKHKTLLPKQNGAEKPMPPIHSGIESCLARAELSPLCLNFKNSCEEDSEDLEQRDKQPRKKRGRYRQYDHDILEEAISMVMSGKMSVSKAQGIYGVPHSTLEYKVKERTGTLKTPPKKKIRLCDQFRDK